jgi:hypothetical protein
MRKDGGKKLLINKIKRGQKEDKRIRSPFINSIPFYFFTYRETDDANQSNEEVTT